MSAVDIHCHILPGLDDGSPDAATSLLMARTAVENGIGTVIATPHWIEGEHETDPIVVRRSVQELQAVLDSNAIALAILPGNEAFICPDLPDRVRRGDVLTLADRKTHLLLELPYENLPMYFDDVVFRLQLQGITPILAHVERYRYVREDWRMLDRWVRRGCLAQINADSLHHGHGDEVVQSLVDRGLVACTATDAHDASNRAPCGIWNGNGLDGLKREV